MCGGFLGIVQIFAVQDFHRALCAHHGDLRAGPRIVDIAAQMFRRHNAIGPAVSFARNDGDFWDRRFAKRIEQFRAVLNQAAIFLIRSWQKARHVHEGQDRNVETITETHKARSFTRRITIEAAREHHRLVRDHANGLPFEANEAAKDILREVGLNFKKIALIRDLVNQLFHIIGQVRIIRHERIEALVNAVMRVVKWTGRHAAAIVQRQEIEQAANFGQRLHVIIIGSVCHGGFRRMGFRPARAWSHDDADLGDNAAREDIILENMV